METEKLYEKGRDQLQNMLEKIPDAKVISVREETSLERTRADFMIDLRTPFGIQRMLVEARNNGFPKTIRDASIELRRIINFTADLVPTIYPVVVVPYITDAGIELCKELNIGCFDLAGNCYLHLGNIHLEIRGKKNPMPTSRKIRSLFSPKSSRVSRVLLSNVQKFWLVKDIAKSADISMALVSNIKNRLVEEDFIFQSKQGVRVRSPKDLLETFAENYKYKRNKISEYYSLRPPNEAEEIITEYCRRSGINYSLGLFSGASRVAPYVRSNKVFVYIDSNFEQVAEATSLKSVQTGSNVMLLRPYDRGIFFEIQEIDGMNVTSDVQLYIDLKSYKGRGEEAAKHLLETRISKKWLPDQIMENEK